MSLCFPSSICVWPFSVLRYWARAHSWYSLRQAVLQLDRQTPFRSRRLSSPTTMTDAYFITRSPHKSAGSSEGSSTRSGAESPTGLSIYSYASAQPPRPSVSTSPPQERRRHRSGGAIQRLKSTDLLEELMRVDKDLLPSVSNQIGNI